MTMMIKLLISIFLITSIIMIIPLVISKKKIINREKMSAFECGFDPFSSPRLPFSIHFFLIGVIFLIFDIEMVLIFPFILTMYNSNLTNYFMLLTFFLIILLMGLYYEWFYGSLNWIN